MGGSTLTEINVGAGHVVSRQIPCGSNPRHVLTNREGNILYVSNNGPGTVTLVDRAAGAVIATIKVGQQARTIALAPDERYLFVCNYGDGTVGCVDLQARAQVLTVPASRPIGMAVSAKGDRLFISNYAPPQVTVMQIVRQAGQSVICSFRDFRGLLLLSRVAPWGRTGIPGSPPGAASSAFYAARPRD